MIITYETVEMKHIWQVYVTSVLFLYCTQHGMNFHSCEKQIIKYFGNTKIANDSKWTKTIQNKVMQPTTSNSNSFQFNVFVHYKGITITVNKIDH